MTVALTDGVLGLEAIHVWTPSNGPALTLNDLSQRFRIKFDRMTGLKSLPEAENNSFLRTARIGETLLPSLVRGKTITIDGRLQAATMADLRQMQWNMSRAFGERDIEGTWSASPHQDYGDNTHYWQTIARVLQLDTDEELTRGRTSLPSPYQTRFLLGLRLADPRWTWTDQQVSPTNAGQVTVTNQGNAPADPTITVTRSGAGTVTITNDTTGRLLQFASLPGTGTLVVNFAARTVTLGGADARTYLDSYASTWWDRGAEGLRSGANTIKQTGGTSIQVNWKHTSW